MYVHIDESLRTYIHIENVLVMELKVHTYIKVIPMYGYIHLVGTTILAATLVVPASSTVVISINAS